MRPIPLTTTPVDGIALAVTTFYEGLFRRTSYENLGIHILLLYLAEIRDYYVSDYYSFR